MSSPEETLTNGLTKGFAGEIKPHNDWNGCFGVEIINSSTSKGNYRDMWKADRTGAGLEFASVGNETVARTYAGGTISHEQLSEIGLTKKEVINYLKTKILELKGRTRLHEECNPEPDGDWQYAYQILLQLEDIPLTIGIETINFRGRRVFAHSFNISPVE